MKRILTLFLFLTLAGLLQAQVTSGSIGGFVTDSNNEALVGATILLTHVPTGSAYGVITQENGGYNIKNLQVGGPYKADVSYLGFESQSKENLFIQLGQKLRLDFELVQSGVSVDEVVVIANLDDILNNERTGAETNIKSDMISKLPTINRSSADLTRMNPMSAEGGSFAGRNDQFNNYSLDGSIFNNPFGLDAATPGGQTDAQPVSLDAIEQINVSIAPYDVTQSGFTGASINAVTKSGTNNISGTAFAYYSNKNFVGGKIDGNEIFKGDPSQLQAGISIGGPIVKNKIFFFANVEREARSDLGSYWTTAGNGSINESRVSAADMELVSSLLKSRYGYETGAYENYSHDANNTKGLLKLDFNLSKQHKLTTTYNFLDAFKDKPAHPSAIGRRGPDFQTLQFENSGYRINNAIQSGKIELKSFIGENMSNNLQVGYTHFEDSRDPFSTPFPVLNIGKNGIRYIVAGHEPFSVNNRLDQKVYQFKNDFSLYSGNHSFLIGASFERFEFDNSFNLTSYGFRVFGPDVDINDLEAFINSGDFDGEVAAAQAAFETNNANDSWALAETNLGQFSVYAQDEIQASKNLVLTLGLRMDMPLYFNTPELVQENIDRKGGNIVDGGVYAPEVTYYNEDGEAITFDHTVLPKQSPLINPRLGFNYDIKGDRSAQLRGGSGLFSGRFPFVWVGNQVANPDFFFYCMTNPDFKYPQIWRTNIGYDQKINDWTFSADVVYTKDLQSAMVRNYGLISPSGTLNSVDNRPIYLDSDRAQGPFGGATNAYVFTNTAAGNSLNLSIKTERTWNNNYVMLAYNYLDAKDAASIDAEISSDAYDRNPANVQNTNIAELAPSLYGNRHRIVGAASKRIEYGKMATTFSLVTEFVEGNRYSYTYSGDINNDGSALNDLIYVPTASELGQMNFSGSDAEQAAQKTALEAFIQQDDYLSSRRGDYAEKYGALSPWYSLWDLRILQDFIFGNEQKISLSIDVLNIGNLVNSGIGVRQYATTSQLYQPIGVSVDSGEPTFSFDTDLNSTYFNDSSLKSRWRMQFGLRYTF